MPRSGYCSLAILSGVIYTVNVLVLLIFVGTSLPEWLILACWVWVFSGLFAMHRIYNVRLSKAVVSTPQALDQVQAAEPSSGTVPHQLAQEESGDFMTITGSNENHEQILHKARRGVILRALAFGIIPGGILFGLYGFLYAYYHGAGGDTNCNEAEREGEYFYCRLLSIKIVLGIVPVVWLFVDIYIRSKMEWRR